MNPIPPWITWEWRTTTSHFSLQKALAWDTKNRDTQCVVVSDCCTAGEVDVHEMTVNHVLPLLVRVRTTDETITALS